MKPIEELMTITSIEDLSRLRAPVETHLQVLEERLLVDASVDIVVGRDVARVLAQLLLAATDYDAQSRALVHAAVDYFVMRDDDDDDLTSPTGLHDDAQMLNEVL